MSLPLCGKKVLYEYQKYCKDQQKVLNCVAEGTFIRFGVDSEDNCEGQVIQYSTALILMPDGEVRTPPAKGIIFLEEVIPEPKPLHKFFNQVEYLKMIRGDRL